MSICVSQNSAMQGSTNKILRTAKKQESGKVHEEKLISNHEEIFLKNKKNKN